MTATFISADSAPHFEVHGARIVAYASPSRGSSMLATWRVSLDAGAKSPRHALDSDECFTCLSGAADFVVAGNTTRVSVGDAIIIAAGTEFYFQVSSDEGFSAMACVRGGAKAQVEGGAPFDPPWAL